ncbi:hypothetical protein LIER_36255 [Lithospermum erythrorhizon]|uniref:Reverse transcriptase domain-containing protein n=1 Tax=Lithospermum erythrorhizon TaxID=34254 RepID=A0AAV3P3P2_LITER
MVTLNCTIEKKLGILSPPKLASFSMNPFCFVVNLTEFSLTLTNSLPLIKQLKGPSLSLSLSRIMDWKTFNPWNVTIPGLALVKDIIGDTLSSIILDFLNNGHILKETNNTFIFLIPKIPHPNSIKDFRPISLCNVIYKIASKVLVNRLKPHLNSLLSPYQNGFIHGIGAQDNILMAQELTHTIQYSKGIKNGLAAIKIDMSKAFDRIKWDFLLAILEKLRFPHHWICLIKECISMVQFSVLVNGRTTTPFKPSCGLRQEDPFFPILFAIFSEALSATLSTHQSSNNLKGIFVARQGPKINHLLFADDSLFFIHLDPKSINAFCTTIMDFCEDSGQIINFNKSFITFIPLTPLSSENKILEKLNTNPSDHFGNYLGISLDIKLKRKAFFSNIVDKIKKKNLSWKSKFLNFAGKATLIKSVFQSILVYPMEIYKFPLATLNEIDKILSNFLSGGTHHTNIHWINWDFLCLDKEFGGLGFKHLHHFNLALLARNG